MARTDQFRKHPVELNRRRLIKWYLLLAILLCGSASALFFKEDPISLAKERLKTKGFSIKPAYRSNPIDRSIRDVKRFLKMEEIRVSRADHYTVTESLEGIQGLNTLAPYIEHLSCGATKIRDSDALIIGKMYQLRHLELYGPDLTDMGVSNLSDLKDLEWFVLYAPQVTDAGLSWLHQCHQLKWLTLTDAKITGSTLKQISNSTELITLKIRNTLVKSSDLQYLTELPKFRMLILSGTQIDDAAAPYLKSMTSLTSVGLNETKVGDEVCQQLIAIPKLEYLELDDTSITDQGVQTLLEGCPQLKSLSIRRCDISANAFTAVKSWPIKLERLNVAGNKLSGAEILKILNDHESLESIGFNARNFDPEIVKQLDSLRATRLHQRLYSR